MPDLLADLRFALRRWTKRPAFAITAILTPAPRHASERTDCTTAKM